VHYYHVMEEAIEKKKSSHTLISEVYWKGSASYIPFESPNYRWNTPQFGNHSSTGLHFRYWHADYNNNKVCI
jgi:hypothetical protein